MFDDFYQNREYIEIAKKRKAQIVFWCIMSQSTPTGYIPPGNPRGLA